MAETETEADTPQKAVESAPKTKATTRRPAKKRATKKPAKKPVKKTRARKKKDESDGEKSTAPRAAKKRSTKKPAKKPRTTDKNEGRTVISSPPSKRRETPQAVAPEEREAVEEKASAENTQPQEAANMQWGRRSKRSGPIAWDERANTSSGASGPSARRQDSVSSEQSAETNAKSQAPAEPPAETPRAEGPSEVKTETPAPETIAADQKREETRKPSRSDRGRNNRGRNEKSDQDNRRSSSRRNNNDRGRNNRGRNEKSDQDNRRSSSQNSDRGRNRGREEKPDSGQPSRTLAEVLAQSWTEDKTRRFLSEGFLSSLSAELIEDGTQETIPEAEALKEPLQMIRKVLADECMVADDVTDLMLLDVVMNALSDRIEVCRLQAESSSLADMDVILDLRYKADKRLIEAVNALKNA